MTMLEILLPVLIILIGLSLLKCPIYISILCSAIYLQIFVNHMSLTNVFTGFFEAMTKNALLAVPFFMVAGSLIAASSLGTRLISIRLIPYMLPVIKVIMATLNVGAVL